LPSIFTIDFSISFILLFDFQNYIHIIRVSIGC